MARLSWPGWLVIYWDRFSGTEDWTPDMVTHLSTNWARRRLTSLIETNVLTTTPKRECLLYVCSICSVYTLRYIRCRAFHYEVYLHCCSNNDNSNNNNNNNLIYKAPEQLLTVADQWSFHAFIFQSLERTCYKELLTCLWQRWRRSDRNVHCSRQHDATDQRHSDCQCVWLSITHSQSTQLSRPDRSMLFLCCGIFGQFTLGKIIRLCYLFFRCLMMLYFVLTLLILGLYVVWVATVILQCVWKKVTPCGLLS